MQTAFNVKLDIGQVVGRSREPYSTQEHAAPEVFSQWSTRHDFGLCVAVHARPWMK